MGNGVEWEIVLFDRKEGKFLSSCMVDRESSRDDKLAQGGVERNR